MSTYSRTDEHIFNFDWTTVVKALWNKYPHKDMDFVIYNKVVDLKLLDEDTILVKKIMYCKKYFLLWSYTLEETKINFKNKILDLETKLIAASKAFPQSGIEKISYFQLPDKPGCTLYTKYIESKSTVSKYYHKLGSSFQKGCEIIEEKCREILNDKNK